MQEGEERERRGKEERERRERGGREEDFYLLSVLLCLGGVTLALPLESLGLEAGGLLLSSVGNHDVSIMLFGGVVCHLADHGGDVAFDGGGRMCGVMDGSCCGDRERAGLCGWNCIHD